jgi:two-component system chemotaxis response regulator CheB
VNLVAIGASTGGPLVLQTVLSGLPGNFSLPVLIVQHMAAGFIQGFVEWLTPTSALPLHVATHGEQILPGHAYIAPDGFQMKLELGKRLSLTKDEPENGHRPSVSYLFRSVADLCGPKAVGVLLTGMGKDGAEELKRMREKGAVTIAQDQESSVVHGMPGEAIRLEAATYVLPPHRIAAALANLSNKRGGAHEER